MKEIYADMDNKRGMKKEVQQQEMTYWDDESLNGGVFVIRDVNTQPRKKKNNKLARKHKGIRQKISKRHKSEKQTFHNCI